MSTAVRDAILAQLALMPVGDKADAAKAWLAITNGMDPYYLGGGGMQADYVVSNVAEFDAALTAIATSLTGASVCLKKGTYDKGSAFVIPNVSHIRIFSEGGAIIQRPLNDCAIAFPNTAPGYSDVTIDNLVFAGNSGNYWYIDMGVTGGLYTQLHTIKNCYFQGYNYGGIRGNLFNWAITNNVFETLNGLELSSGWGGGENLIRNNLFNYYDTNDNSFINTGDYDNYGNSIESNLFNVYNFNYITRIHINASTVLPFPNYVKYNSVFINHNYPPAPIKTPVSGYVFFMAGTLANAKGAVVQNDVRLPSSYLCNVAPITDYWFVEGNRCYAPW